MDSFPTWGRYYLPADALIRRHIESSLAWTFEARGYEEIVPPLLVGLDMAVLDSSGSTFTNGLAGAEKPYAVLARDGSFFALRSDMTVPVAALAVRHLLPSESPVRLYYSGSVFRPQKAGNGKPEERRQFGAELIGTDAADSVKADCEILAMAAEGLINTGVRDFCIGLSDAKLFLAMLDAARVEDDAKDAIWSALASRDYVRYGELVSSLDDGGDPQKALGIDLLKRLLALESTEESLDALRRAGVCDAASELIRILDVLEERGLGKCFRLDLSIVREFRYYTGVVFEGYAVGCANAVIGGGRYDKLLARFGSSAPAAGLAVDVDAVVSALQAVEGGERRWNRYLWPNARPCAKVRSRH
ncbi:MAG: ATP phosphoribosyltransferase regulatory subunit [Bacillota bacterium]|nr:ATP phosphoribosyltransferase regulatory subunit [Bacillota bacterium]HPQ02731.1 ATP phosphoribosyltransferase regulatory subunit [Bacillota bacterium]